MTTQYTTILKLALPVQGELSGTWGDVVNDNITQMVEQAVAGKAVINTWTANSHTLTTADGTTSESRCAILELTDSGTALTGAGTVVCPTNTKLYIVDNNTAEIITVQTAAGTGVAVPVGKTMLVYCDGTNVVEGVTHANSLSLGTSTVTADKILDEDNMASDSATAIATQQSIKAYVDSQVGTVDTLAEILANGNTTGANDIDVDSAQKVQFRDAAIYLNSSVDGQLDIVADTEIQIAATTVDLNGDLDVSGTALVAGVLTTTAATVFNGGFASNADSTLGTDKKVQFRDAAIYLNSSVDGQLDIVADGEVQIDTALVDINGNLDVSGTTNISGSVSFTKNAIAGVAISTTSRSSNTVTVTTSAVHGLTSGDLVNVNGVADTSFNGYFTVSVSSTTVFTYNQTGSDGSSTGGTSTEVVYNLNASGTALNWMNGPLNIAANSGIDGLEITQSGAGNGLHVTGTTGLTGNLDVGGTTNDGTALVQIAQSGTGRAFSVNRNVVSATRAVVNLAQLQASGGAEAVLDIQQTTPASRAIKVTPDGSIDRFSVYGTGALVTTPVAGGHAVFNEGGVDADFRVESDGNTHMLFVDGGANHVNIGTATDLGGVLNVSSTDNTDTLVVYSSDDDTDVGPIIRLWRNSSSPADNDGIGAILFSGEDSADAKTDYASIESFALDVTSGTEDGELTLYTVLAGAKVNRLDFNSTETIFNSPGADLDFRVESDTYTHALFVQGSDGNVGIGVTPTEKLDISQSVNNSVIAKVTNTNSGDLASARVEAHNNDSSFGQLTTYSSGFDFNVLGSNAANWTFLGASGSNSNGLKIGTLTADPVVFGTSDLERMRIDASGNVGIGTSSPVMPLDVMANAGANALSLRTRVGNDYSFLTFKSNDGTEDLGGLTINRTAANTSNLLFYTNSGGSAAERMRIDSVGSVGIGVTPSTWSSTVYDALQIGGSIGVGAIVGRRDGINQVHFGLNWNYDGGATNTYVGSSFATNYSQETGTHRWFSVASGTAGDAFTFSESMRIDASGNLLVGTTTSPAGSGGVSLTNKLTVGYQGVLNGFGAENVSGLFYSGGASGGYVAINSDSGNSPLYISLTSSATASNLITFSDSGTAVGSIGTNSGYMVIGSPVGSGGHLLIGNDLVHPATSTGSGKDNAIDIGGSSNRFKDLYLSGGVVFGTTGGAVTSKTLDDYEEGTWTPVLSKSTTAPTVTYTTQTGTYTKVGRMIYVSGLLSWTAISGGTGDFHITNLPFTLLNSSGAYPQLVCVDYNGVTFGANDTTFGGFGAPNATYIVLLVAKNNATNSTVISGLAGSGFMYFNLTYQAA
jgi:hypothetical protein